MLTASHHPITHLPQNNILLHFIFERENFLPTKKVVGHSLVFTVENFPGNH